MALFPDIVYTVYGNKWLS